VPRPVCPESLRHPTHSGTWVPESRPELAQPVVLGASATPIAAASAGSETQVTQHHWLHEPLTGESQWQ
jgi:hypothetical protein